MADLPPTIVRQYIICPDCGRSAPDVDGRCADCHDAKRLRDAVGEWADNVGAVRVGSPEQRLLHLARELGLVDGGAA